MKGEILCMEETDQGQQHKMSEISQKSVTMDNPYCLCNSQAQLEAPFLYISNKLNISTSIVLPVYHIHMASWNS